MQHTSGRLKQTNKKHKTKSIGKRARKRQLGPGKVNNTPRSSVNTSNTSGSKHSKTNNFHQKLKKQRSEITMRKLTGTFGGPPKLIAVLNFPLQSNDDNEFLSKILSQSDFQKKVNDFHYNANFNNHKLRCSFILPNDENDSLLSRLDVSKMADILLLNINVKNFPLEPMFDQVSLNFFSALKALGHPDMIIYLDGLEQLNGQKLIEVRKLSFKYLESILYNQLKIFDHTNFSQMIRIISNTIPTDISWREIRSYIVPESFETIAPSLIEMVNTDDASNTISYKIKGYLRGQPLRIDSLLYTMNHGTYRIESINLTNELGFDHNKSSEELDFQSINADSTKVDISMYAEKDILAGDQTWPLEEEIKEIASMVKTEKRMPNGVSEYQADWYLNEDGTYNSDIEEDSDNENSNPEYFENLDSGAFFNENHSNPNRLMELEEELKFPDEVDTPIDILAKDRFTKYRALQSFRNSSWHPKLNLPLHYSEIFHFENFQTTQNNILLEGKKAFYTQRESYKPNLKFKAKTSSNLMEQDIHPLLLPNTDRFISSGYYVEIVIKSISKDDSKIINDRFPIYIFSMLPHENKISVIHYNIQRNTNSQEIIKSKDELIFMSGFKMFKAAPVYSESNLNCDKHKFERFLQPGKFSVASIIGQITYSPTPLLIFKELETKELQLVASGNLASVDADRIIIKKIILSGFPVRVRKRYAVVKHMFYSPEDVRWFKPAELVTKHGLRGNIREPIGTHGLFKAVFNGPIKQNDTVMLSLYKRIFPKPS